MKVITAALGVTVIFMLMSDISYRVGIARFNHGANGTAALGLATRFNPLNMDAKFAQMETLFNDWSLTGNSLDLREAQLIAQSLVRSLPGNAQAKFALATATGLRAAHPLDDVLFPAAFSASAVAIESDSQSVSMIEQQMFNLAAFRLNRPLFLQLGIKRAAITREPLRMVCSLCGKPWLEHRR